jgi:hypothetical protein
MPPVPLCSLSRRIYRSLSMCHSPANYKAEVALSDRKRFTLYFCNEHMSKAFLVAQVEAACRQADSRPEAKVRSIHFRYIQHPRARVRAATASDDSESA